LLSSTRPTLGDRADAEKQLYLVRAKLIGYKQELGKTGDHDFHIVIADLDDPGKTMIVEIPDPDCDGVCRSQQLAAIKQARQDFANAFPDNPPIAQFELVQGDVQVEVTGPALFDFFHSQTGVATNCIELHPILKFRFISGGPLKAARASAKDPAMQPLKTLREEHTCIGETRE
jgi:hypothetical protein